MTPEMNYFGGKNPGLSAMVAIKTTLRRHECLFNNNFLNCIFYYFKL